MASHHRSTSTNRAAHGKAIHQGGLSLVDYYDAEAKALNGSDTLANLKSVLKLGQEKRESPLPENASASATNIVNLRANLKSDQVRESDFS